MTRPAKKIRPAPKKTLCLGTSPQMTKPRMKAQISEVYSNGARIDTGARRKLSNSANWAMPANRPVEDISSNSLTETGVQKKAQAAPVSTMKKPLEMVICTMVFSCSAVLRSKTVEIAQKTAAERARPTGNDR